MFASYHTHSTLCRHARGEAREYVENAIRGGLSELGFSDHAPMPFPKEWDYYSSFRMFPEQTEEYVSTVRALAKEYEKDIRIFLGFETEYYPALFADFLEFIRPFDVDYLILGQHFLGNEYISPASSSRLNDKEHLTAYVDQTLAGLSTGKFTYFAHPDLVPYTEDDAFYTESIRRLCNGAKEMGIPLEINLLGIREGRHYPTEKFFRIAGECGCQAILGCDAHSPEKAADLASAQEALALAERCNIPVLDRITPIPPTREV